MASQGMTSSTAVSALLQKASQQYLECRRKVTAKADEVKALESEIQTLFTRITSLADGSHATKSVGRIELHIVTLEGVAPVDDAVVTVEIDPEYEEPEAVVAEAVAEAEEAKEDASAEATTEDAETTKEDVEATKEDAETTKEDVEATKEDAEATKEDVDATKGDAEEATDATYAEEETEAKVSEDDQEKKEEKAEEEEGEATDATAEEPAAGEVEKKEEAVKEKPRRSVRWNDTESLPLDVVFDPVQSREAVVTISIAAAPTDGEENEPVKEFRIPVASLFQKGEINRWYVLKKVEHVHVDKVALTGVADEDETPKEKTEEPEMPKAEEVAETPAEKQENAEETEEKKTEDAETAEPVAAEESEKDDEAPMPEVSTAPHQTPVSAEATVESEDKITVLQQGKLHVQVHFTMSEIEKLSQTAIALSQQKQEAEAVLAVLDREASSLRIKYERLNASQRSLSAGGVVKPRSTLLGGRGLGGAAVARVEKSTYQKVKDSVTAVLTPQRTQVLTSFAIFCGSVALFHFQGDNLLA